MTVYLDPGAVKAFLECPGALSTALTAMRHGGTVNGTRCVPFASPNPALDPVLAGLLLHALATGETAPLADWLTERYGDRDLAAAVRANVLREVTAMEVATGLEAMPPVNPAEFTAPVHLRDVPIRVVRHLCLLCGRYPVGDPDRCECPAERRTR